MEKASGQSGQVVSGANLRWRFGEGELEGRTTERGEFVLYFQAPTVDDHIRSGGRAYVRGDMENTKIKVNIISKNGDIFFIDRIEVGKLIVVMRSCFQKERRV